MKLDPDAASVLELMAGRPPVETLTPEEARAVSRANRRAPAEREPVGAITEESIEGPSGPTKIRIYRPATDERRSALVLFHGGGWVLGDLDGHDPLCRRLANLTGAVVVSVDYHLAPEFPYPTALDEAVRAFAFVVDHAGEIGVDPDRVAIGGDSAGGNLATAASLLLRDRGGPRPLAQLLVYPVVQCHLDAGGFDASCDTVVLSAKGMAWFCRHYLQGRSEPGDPYASPLSAASLEGLPPAVVVTAEVDVLRSQVERYVERLRGAGVPVSHLPYTGVYHGFFGLVDLIGKSRLAVSEASESLVKLLG